MHADYLLRRPSPTRSVRSRKAIAGLGGVELDGKQVAAALARAAEPPRRAEHRVRRPRLRDRRDGCDRRHGTERPALWSHLLLYHADDDLGGDPAWQKAIVIALDDQGGPGERELLRHVAADPRTKPGLATLIRTRSAND